MDSPSGRGRDSTAEQRRAKARRRSQVGAGLVVAVLALGVLFAAVMPAPTFLRQRSDTATAETELAQVQAERAAIQREIERLETDEEIERQARNVLGFSRPGEEVFHVLPAPVEPLGLPDVWPFTGVERALGAG